jgi:hypothetical protein
MDDQFPFRGSRTFCRSTDSPEVFQKRPPVVQVEDWEEPIEEGHRQNLGEKQLDFQSEIASAHLARGYVFSRDGKLERAR